MRRDNSETRSKVLSARGVGIKRKMARGTKLPQVVAKRQHTRLFESSNPLARNVVEMHHTYRRWGIPSSHFPGGSSYLERLPRLGLRGRPKSAKQGTNSIAFACQLFIHHLFVRHRTSPIIENRRKWSTWHYQVAETTDFGQFGTRVSHQIFIAYLQASFGLCTQPPVHRRTPALNLFHDA